MNHRNSYSWWTEEYGMINKGGKAVGVLCSGAIVRTTWSVKRHFEKNHKSLPEKSKEKQKEFIARANKNKNMQSISLMKFIGSLSNKTAAGFDASNIIAKHGQPFSDGKYLKEAWLK